mgnify:CR=1 FL=1|tara:strand:+ start:56 stop:259 length:204 start_codon:yes stop_codon:yes gene_type:complete
MSSWSRIGMFLKYLILTIFTIGFYPFYFWISRQQDTIDLLVIQNKYLEDIRDEIGKPIVIREKKAVK